ncbi:MAG: hypothetical protein ACRDJJ_10300 [Actinomycetota bacterium]
MRLRLIAGSILVAFTAAACGGGGDGPADTGASDRFGQPLADAEAYPVFASPEIVVGENRLLVGLLNQDDAPIGSPKIEVHMSFFDLSRSEEEPVTEADLRFVPIDRFRGVYVADVTFESAGRWGAEATIQGDGYDEVVRTKLPPILEETTTPQIGERVPSVDTPTADDVAKLSEISTDRDPSPRFYEQSIAEAVRAGDPFVVIFATPKFCQSATCGPMLKIVQKVAPQFPNLTFIHVEPYDLDKVPDQLAPVPSALKWGLPSEPWTFVVGEGARLEAKYAVVLSPEELRSSLEAL